MNYKFNDRIILNKDNPINNLKKGDIGSIYALSSQAPQYSIYWVRINTSVYIISDNDFDLHNPSKTQSKFQIGDKVKLNRDTQIYLKGATFTINSDEKLCTSTSIPYYEMKEIGVFGPETFYVDDLELTTNSSYTTGSGILSLPPGYTFSQPLAVSKFQVGDRVKYTYKHSSPTLSTGDLGTIVELSPDIKDYYTVKFDNCNYPLLTAGHDLEFVSAGKSLQELQNLNYKSNTSHKCKFNKTYTGLNYKEDMCDCGKGINRRGIYDA